MCANYQPPTRADLEDYFGATLPVGADLPEAYPGSLAPIIRRARDATGQPARKRTVDLALFGPAPHWAGKLTPLRVVGTTAFSPTN